MGFLKKIVLLIILIFISGCSSYDNTVSQKEENDENLQTYAINEPF
jgi:PBP1b-binding outer membrane lipoprotein LpoB